jgi:ribosomal protein L28
MSPRYTPHKVQTPGGECIGEENSSENNSDSKQIKRKKRLSPNTIKKKRILEIRGKKTRLEAAANEIENGRMAIRNAAKHYGVSASTLSTGISKFKGKGGRPSRVLTKHVPS